MVMYPLIDASIQKAVERNNSMLNPENRMMKWVSNIWTPNGGQPLQAAETMYKSYPGNIVTGTHLIGRVLW